MGLKLKDANETAEVIEKIKELLTYFDEVVLCTPKGLYDMYSISPARGDDRLYIHGVNQTKEDEE